MELWGNLKDFSLPDVIQLVGFGRKSGVLGVEHKGTAAKLYFQEGNVIHAEMGSLTGEDAVYMLFRLGEGEFRFKADLKPPTQSIFMDPTNLVMEAARLLDEAAKEKYEQEQNGLASEQEEAQKIVAAPDEPELPGELPEITFEGLGEGVIEYDAGDSYGILPLAEETAIYLEPEPEPAPAPPPPAKKVTAAEIKEELKALLEQKFGKESKRLLQAVEKCGDTEDEFQQLVTRVERFVSAFMDPKSASKIAEELKQVVSKFSG